MRPDCSSKIQEFIESVHPSLCRAHSLGATVVSSSVCVLLDLSPRTYKEDHKVFMIFLYKNGVIFLLINTVLSATHPLTLRTLTPSPCCASGPALDLRLLHGPPCPVALECPSQILEEAGVSGGEGHWPVGLVDSGLTRQPLRQRWGVKSWCWSLLGCTGHVSREQSPGQRSLR